MYLFDHLTPPLEMESHLTIDFISEYLIIHIL